MNLGARGLSAKLHSAMSDTSIASPTKRRKTKGAFAMKPKKVTWPPNRLPVEIFTLIISYLPRSNILNMRLVNKEFDQKVAEFLFRIVVVPFRPEIYGITQERKVVMGANEVVQSSILLQDRGMRVFQGFGPHIQKFAMSFEIDHYKLAHPPIKSDQEAITSFWGIYRWPFKDYNRYSQLEGLEQTADETKTMQQALKFVNKAKELGISIDGGLGWLAGPDTNERVLQRGETPSVFGSSRFMPEPKARQSKLGKGLRASSADLEGSGSYAAIERMLQEAGYAGHNLDRAIRAMRETEELMAADPPVLTPLSSFTANNITDTNTNRRRYARALQIATNNDTMLVNTDEDGTILSEDEFTNFVEDQEAQPAVADSNRIMKAKTETYPLKPNDLTNAQREMLLEMEWAQSAFMTSFVIAIIDNTATFGQIETLTIARLPHGHLSKLKRKDFWNSLPNLQKLSLAVIPDWRRVKKEATGWVQDDRVSPSESVTVVCEIFLEQISQRPNITTVHFEWICGGEYAPGIFARNQHILAAPFVTEAKNMVNRTQGYQVLALPYVQHLSLKNCWFSPHIMSKALFPLKSILQSLKFDSVSLTAPITPGIKPNPLTQAAIVRQAQALAGQAAANNLMLNFPAAMQNIQAAVGIAPPAQPVVQVDVSSEPEWLQAPRAGSWTQFIDMFTPGTRLADIRYARDLGEEPEPREKSSITKLEFHSCGYVRLPLDFDQNVLDSTQPAAAQTATVAKRFNEFEGFMMKHGDSYLASIVNHMAPVEVQALDEAWNMTVGWLVNRPEFAADAALDGVREAGNGRFDGLIEIPRST